jgi:hypothetical protein
MVLSNPFLSNKTREELKEKNDTILFIDNYKILIHVQLDEFEYMYFFFIERSIIKDCDQLKTLVNLRININN